MLKLNMMQLNARFYVQNARYSASIKKIVHFIRNSKKLFKMNTDISYSSDLF